MKPSINVVKKEIKQNKKDKKNLATQRQKNAFAILKKTGHRFGQGKFQKHIDYAWELNNAHIQKENSTEFYNI